MNGWKTGLVNDSDILEELQEDQILELLAFLDTQDAFQILKDQEWASAR